MNLSKVSTLLALAWATLFASLEAVRLGTPRENSNASVMLQEQSLSNTSLESPKLFALANQEAYCAEPCKKKTFMFGGPSGGGFFDDLNELQLFHIETIVVRSGKWVDSIQVTYKGDRKGPKHGGDGGGEHRCELSDDNPIVEVQLSSGRFIDSLTFIKKNGARCGSFGGSGGSKHQVKAPNGYVLGSIFGKSGKLLNSLGFYWVDPLECAKVKSKQGSWVNIMSFPVQTKYKIKTGVTRSDSFWRSTEWEREISASLSSGFSFAGLSSKRELGGKYSKEVTESYAKEMIKSETKTVIYTFSPGSLWQWRFKLEDECGVSLLMKDLQITANKRQEPCCPPNMFVNISNPIGYCISDEVTLDSDHCPLRGKQ